MRARDGEASEADRLGDGRCELGGTPQVLMSRYAEFVRSAIPRLEWEMIRSALQRGQLTGNERFVEEVATVIGRRIEHRQPATPRLKPEK